MKICQITRYIHIFPYNDTFHFTPCTTFEKKSAVINFVYVPILICYYRKITVKRILGRKKPVVLKSTIEAGIGHFFSFYRLIH